MLFFASRRGDSYHVGVRTPVVVALLVTAGCGGSLTQLRADNQRLAKPSKIRAKFLKRLGDKGPLPMRRIRLTPEIRFDNIKRQNRPDACRACQGRVINRAQIALEPDDLQDPSAFGR